MGKVNIEGILKEQSFNIYPGRTQEATVELRVLVTAVINISDAQRVYSFLTCRTTTVFSKELKYRALFR